MRPLTSTLRPPGPARCYWSEIRETGRMSEDMRGRGWWRHELSNGPHSWFCHLFLCLLHQPRFTHKYLIDFQNMVMCYTLNHQVVQKVGPLCSTWTSCNILLHVISQYKLSERRIITVFSYSFHKKHGCHPCTNNNGAPVLLLLQTMWRTGIILCQACHNQKTSPLNCKPHLILPQTTKAGNAPRSVYSVKI